LIHRLSGLAARLAGGLWAATLSLLAATWRVRCSRLEEIDGRLARGEPFILGFWHGEYFPLFPLLAGRRAVIFASRSFRGAVIAEVCRRFGYRCVTIAERGAEAHAALRTSLAGASACGIAVDGPRGPYHRVKRGVPRLAAALGWPIVPAAVAVRGSLVLRRWDRRVVPLPGAVVALAAGEPLRVPPALTAGEEEQWAARLRDRLEALAPSAAALAAGPCALRPQASG
jgi:lysophospholipid acyltransferase (LPLAT)-like uncharacterized protein